MKLIPLSQGLFAKVNNADFQKVQQFKWSVQKVRHKIYAARYFGDEYVYLHQFILGHKWVDHRDGDGLNCQRANLRPATVNQNNYAFKHPRKNKTSKFRGVCWASRRMKWFSQIQCDGKHFNLGYFDSEMEAAKAYDCAAKRLFKNFSCPNL